MKYVKFLLTITFTIVLHVSIYYSSYLEYFDLKIYDLLTQVSDVNDEKINSSVVVVDIDEKSLEHLGQWPWSRLLLSQLLSEISSAHPTSIGFDILFAEEDKTSLKNIQFFYKQYFSRDIKIDGIENYFYDNDKIFANKIKKSKVILPVYLNNHINNKSNCFLPTKNQKFSKDITQFYEAKSLICNIDILQKNAYMLGFINSKLDSDGILRRIPLFIKNKDTIYPSFSLANLMSISDLSVKEDSYNLLNHTFKTADDSSILLHFYDINHYKSISAIDLLRKDVDKSFLKGKFVLIGTTAVGLHDRYMIANSKIIPGVFVHATFIDNLLNEDLIYEKNNLKNINFFSSLLLSIVLVILILRNNFVNLLGVFFSLWIGANVLGLYFLDKGIYISIGYFLTPFVVHFFLLSMIFLFIHYRQRQNFFKELFQAHSSAIDSMTLVAETRDTETGAHIKRTKEYMIVLGEYLYKNTLHKKILTSEYRELIYRATPLHDVGKVGIADSILKKEGKLTEDEFTQMKEHPIIGKNIIENAIKENGTNKFLKIAYNIAYSHHEKWDGSGYPQGLSKEEIPLEARMMAISDVYDALVSRRCYKKAFSFEDSEQIIIEGKGSHFDPLLVEAFIHLKEKFKEIAQRIQE